MPRSASVHPELTPNTSADTSSAFFGTARPTEKKERQSTEGDTRRRQVEREIQKGCVRLFDHLVKDDRAFLYAVPNGEPRNDIVRQILAGQGVRPGVFDLVLLLPGGRSVYVEVKRPEEMLYIPGRGYRNRRAGELSEAQKRFAKILDGLGFEKRVVRSIAEFENVLVEFGVIRRGPGGALLNPNR